LKINNQVIVAFLIFLSLGTLIGYAVLFRQISFGAEPQASSTQDPIIAEMISKISESEIYDTVAYLTQTIGTRHYGTSGNTLAGTYLYNRLGNISGLTVEYQSSYRNVIATLPSNSSEIYIVGAHYDTVSGSPGATDDAGGVAIVLELARIMSQYRFKYTLKFAFWNREEAWNPTGATVYVQQAAQNTSLYFNYDSSVLNKATVLDIMYDDQSIADMLTQQNTLYGIGVQLNYNGHYGHGVTCTSDYVPFKSSGKPWVMTHSQVIAGTPTPDNGADHSYQHSIYDTVDKVSTAFAKKNGQIGMSVLAELAEVQGPWSPIDTVPPHISILSPTNKTYSTNSLPLTFVLNESTSWMGYSLDSQMNTTVIGNTSLIDLSEGSHTIKVYANGTTGIMGHSETVYFSVDTTPCNIEILSPENKTYSTSSISLDFTFNELTSWITYSFDKKANVTITGNVTLSELPDGSHNVIVYAKDMAGNTGASEMIYFSIDTQEKQPFVPALEPYIGAVLAIIAAAVIGLVLYGKRKQLRSRSSTPDMNKHSSAHIALGLLMFSAFHSV
jgi:hypothetical protein